MRSRLPCTGALVLCCLAVSGCAARQIAFPADPGMPLPDFEQIHTMVSSGCASVRTLTAELGLSGHAGEQSIRGRVIAGFERPDAMRLTAVAPFGAPAFVLAADNGRATLLLPRDGRAVEDAAPEEILGALTGVTLAPGDLQAILTGCVVPMPRATAGSLHANGWASIALEGGATVYLQPADGGWRLRGARRDGWRIEYPEWDGSFPRAVRLQGGEQGIDVELTATISQLEANIDLDESAWRVDVPADVLPLSLEELREAGPLRGAP